MKKCIDKLVKVRAFIDFLVAIKDDYLKVELSFSWGENHTTLKRRSLFKTSPLFI